MSDTARTLSALRKFTRPTAAPERCELCAAALADEHEHLLDPKQRKLVCACRACMLLFPPTGEAPYRSLVARAERLTDVTFGEREWSLLDVPVRLVMLTPSLVHERLFAIYPNPGGATETALPLSAWHALSERHPRLRELLPDAEGLVVDARSEAVRTSRVSLDVVYRLVGELRSHAGAPHAAMMALERALASLFGGGHG